METVDRFLFYMFILSLLLIAVAYYAGTQGVVSSVGSALGKLFLIGQGRNPATGQFASYPGGGPTQGAIAA